MIQVDVDMLLGRLRRKISALRDSDPQGACALTEFLQDELHRAPKGHVTRNTAARQAVLWAAETAGMACGVERSAILGTARTRSVSRARAIAVALCKARYGWSHAELGRAFGLDHKSVLAALRRSERDTMAVCMVRDEHRRRVPDEGQVDSTAVGR